MTSPAVPAIGDVLFTTGDGWISRVIKHGSASHWSHCGIVTGVGTVQVRRTCHLLNQRCTHVIGECERVVIDVTTHEAYGDGLLPRRRWLVQAAPAKRQGFLLARVTSCGFQARELVAASAALVAGTTGYDWWEIVRIGLRVCGLEVAPVDRFTTRNICSGHTARAVTAVRPELRELLPVPAFGVWPGALRECLTQLAGVEEVWGWVPLGPAAATVPTGESYVRSSR